MKLNDKLHAYWSKKENDIMLYYPMGQCTKADARFLSGILNKEAINELSKRGYDVTTLKFSIEPKAGNERFVSQRPPKL